MSWAFGYWEPVMITLANIEGPGLDKKNQNCKYFLTHLF